MQARDEREHRARRCAMHDDDGNFGGGVDAGGDFDEAGGFVAGRGRGGADSEARLLGVGPGGGREREQARKENCGNAEWATHEPFSVEGAFARGRESFRPRVKKTVFFGD
jgi:hypothetical protein